MCGTEKLKRRQVDKTLCRDLGCEDKKTPGFTDSNNVGSFPGYTVTVLDPEPRGHVQSVGARLFQDFQAPHCV